MERWSDFNKKITIFSQIDGKMFHRSFGIEKNNNNNSSVESREKGNNMIGEWSDVVIVHR